MSSVLARVREQRMLRDSALVFATTVLIALAGAAFWLIAARLQPTDVVGVGASLISASIALSFFAQLGLNQASLRVLPHSSSPGADLAVSMLVVAGAGLALGLGYALLTPLLSDDLAFVGHDPWLVLLFAVLVLGAGVNLYTDSAFLATGATHVNLWTNGVLMGIAKCGLPFAFVAWHAFGLYAAVGLATLAAAAASAAALLRRAPRPALRLTASPELRASRRFALASYSTSVIDMLPILLLPLLVLAASGASANGLFFVAFQVATLLNSVVFAISQSMFAEGSRHPDRAAAVLRRGAAALAVVVPVATVVVVALAGLLMRIFGSAYADGGTTTLRVLALGALGVAFNNWAMVRLRLADDLLGMNLAQAAFAVTTVGLAWVLADHGIAWVALAWGVGNAVGGLVGLLVGELAGGRSR